MAYVPERKLAELAKKYKYCREVSAEECPIAPGKMCSGCMYFAVGAWGTGEIPDVCMGVKRNEDT